MKYRLSVQKPWRYRDHKHAYRELAPGTYDVPDRVPLDVAHLCVAQGMGVLKPLPGPPEEAGPASPNPPAPPPEPAAVSRPRRGRRKGPAPENKIAHASENKTTLV